MDGYRITHCQSAQLPDWLALRTALWPDAGDAGHRDEMAAIATRADALVLLAFDGTDCAVGLAEASLRRDYVNGTRSSPVAFLESIYVAPAQRGQGLARALIAEVERWAVGLGCTELASDAALANTGSHAMHRSLGFAETERIVFFLQGPGMTHASPPLSQPPLPALESSETTLTRP